MKPKTFRAFLFLELGRVWNKRNVAVAIIIIASSLFLMNQGIHQYQEELKNQKIFQETEKLKVNEFKSYSQYGGYGFRLMFMPSPLIIYFNNANLFTELNAQIDVGEKLNIYHSLKGKNAFAQKPGRLMDFSGMLLLMGSMIAFFYGFDAFRHREYLRSLVSMFGATKVFIFTWMVRALILSLFFILTFVLSLSLPVIYNISFSPQEWWYLAGYFLVSLLLTMIFFMTIGAIVSTIRIETKKIVKRKSSIIKFIWKFLGTFFKYKFLPGILAWFLTVYIIPAFLNIWITNSTDHMESNYQLELDKLNTVMDFEGEAQKPGKDDLKFGILTKLTKKLEEEKIQTIADLLNWFQTERDKVKIAPNAPLLENIFKEIEQQIFAQDIVQLEKPEDSKLLLVWRAAQKEIHQLANKRNKKALEMLKLFLVERFPRIEEKEKRLEREMTRYVSAHHVLSSCFPSTFYLSLNMEMSSRGYKNLVKFHRFAAGTKKRFIEFYHKERSQEIQFPGRNRGKVTLFLNIDKGENIFHSTSRLPDRMILGFAISIVWNILAIFFCYWLYQRLLFHQKASQANELKNLGPIHLAPGTCHVLSSTPEILNEQLFSLFSGKYQDDVSIIDDGSNPMSERKKRYPFIYYFLPDQMPRDIKVILLISFFLRTRFLEQNHKLELEEKLKNYQIDKQDTFAEITDKHKKGLVLLEILGRMRLEGKILMFYNFAAEMPTEFYNRFFDRIDLLKDKKIPILYMSNDIHVARRIGDYISLRKEET